MIIYRKLKDGEPLGELGNDLKRTGADFFMIAC